MRETGYVGYKGKKPCVLTLALLSLLLLLSACPALGLTEVSELEPSGKTGGGLLSGFVGGNWEDLQNALIEARKNGETEITLKLDSGTFQDLTETDHLWYYIARAGVQSAGCSYWQDGRVRLTDISWWPWPMYLVHSREDFTEAVLKQKSKKGQTFGMLPDEALFHELMDDDRMRDRLEYRSGLTGYESLYYSKTECSIWYPDPVIEDVVYLEVSGPAACAEALREAISENPGVRIVLAVDSLTYTELSRDKELKDNVLSAAGLRGGYQSNDKSWVYVFPAGGEACYPGFLIAETVR